MSQFEDDLIKEKVSIRNNSDRKTYPKFYKFKNL